MSEKNEKDEVEVIDFLDPRGDENDILIPDFASASKSGGRREKKIHKTDFVISVTPASSQEGHVENDREVHRRKKKPFIWDKLVLSLLALAVVLCVWIITKDINNDELDAKEAKEAVALQYDEDILEEEQTTQTPVRTMAAVYKPDNNVICLDAGHGGDDPGAEYKSKYEKEQALEITLIVKQLLEQKGYTVVLTRSSDITLSLDERVSIAEKANAGVLVSIHRNYYKGYSESDTAGVSGIEYWINNSNPGDANKLTGMIMTELNKLDLSNNRGIKRGTITSESQNYKINTSKCTSCIIELGFITSPRDDALVTSRKNECAGAIADGIDNYIKSIQ